MNSIKKTALLLFMAIFFGATSSIAFSEEVADGSAASITETIALIEKAACHLSRDI